MPCAAKRLNSSGIALEDKDLVSCAGEAGGDEGSLLNLEEEQGNESRRFVAVVGLQRERLPSGADEVLLVRTLTLVLLAVRRDGRESPRAVVVPVGLRGRSGHDPGAGDEGGGAGEKENDEALEEAMGTETKERDVRRWREMEGDGERKMEEDR